MSYESEARELYVSLADAILQDATADFELLPSEGSRQQLLATTLYASLIETTCDCIVLLEQPSAAALGSVVKLTMESYADLRAILQDDQYADRMQATFYKEKERLIKRILKTPENPFFAAMASKIDTAAERVSMKNALASHKARGHKPLKNLDRLAALSDSGENYGAFYWRLCSQSHNNVAAIQQRHFLIAASGTAPELFKPIDAAVSLQYLDILLSMVIHASEQIHLFMKTGAETRYDDHLKDLRQLRESIAETTVSEAAGG